MPDAVTHPTTQELAAFGLGKLPERAAATIAAHLQSCTACRNAVACVSADSFLGKVRAAGQHGSSLLPNVASSDKAPNSPAQPAIPVVPCSDVPPELVRHPKYLILRELGRGGMGVIYQARHREMDRQIVIKVINRALLERPDSLERFRREIRAAAQLSHPNIVTAYDAEQIGDAHMLVMEFVPGQSLAEVLKKKGSLPVTNACHYVRQVALGLQHAYERKMVHRDIKPQNLMLTPKGQVKILDFGLAKVVREECTGTGTGLTSHNAYMGTPDYCAPEQATDARTADIRADLYSLGCTLYCLLAGHPPFQEDTVVKTILAHLQKAPQPLPELHPDVSGALWRVVARLLAKEPSQRYEKPIELAQALVPFIKSGSKPEAKGSSSRPPSVKSPVKGTVIEADTNEVKKILQAVTCQASPQEVPTKSEASPFENLVDTSALPRKSRESTKRERAEWFRRWPVLAGVGVLLLALLGMWANGVFVKTKYGTIVLENLPHDAEVWVDGEMVTVAWGGGGKRAEIRVKPGPHEVKVRPKDGSKVEVKKDGLSVDAKELTFRDGDRVIFTVRLLPNKSDVTEKPEAVGGAPPAKKSPPPSDTKKPGAPGIPGDVDDDKGFKPLFNGKDLNGWNVDGGPPGQWVVEGNTIAGQSKSFQTRNYLLAEKDYSDFVLHFEFKVEEGSNGGIAIRAIEGDKMPQRGGALLFDHPIIKLTNPAMEKKQPTGTAHWLKSAAVDVSPVEVLPLRAGIWHSMEVVVRGNNCTATVGGKKLVDLTLDPDVRNNGVIVPGLGRRKGKIGFQIHTGILRFRKIEIKELTAANSQAAPARGAAAEDKGSKPPFPKNEEENKDEKWIQEVAALPAELQVKAVADKLKERNPGFDGDVKPTIEDGSVTGLKLVSDDIKDLSPLRALSGLKWLWCEAGISHKSELADLTPLRGLSLSYLHIRYSAVSDLSPLRGMKELKHLHILVAPLSDLKPLEGLKLTNVTLHATRVEALSPLKGMPLIMLNIHRTRVKDLSPLKGMKLEDFCYKEQPVDDISVLKDMPLRVVACDFRRERDEAVLRSIKTLKTINRKPVAEFWQEVDGR